MSERTHFRCAAYGLLSVARCRANRQLPLGLRVPGNNVPSGQVRPVACRLCIQAPAVDAGTEPTLTTLAAIEADVRGYEELRVARWDRALPPDSPMVAVGVGESQPPRSRARKPVSRPKVNAKQAPAPRGDPPAIPQAPRPAAPFPSASLTRRIVRLLRDAASGRVGLPALQLRARRLLKPLGRQAPPAPTPPGMPLHEYEQRTRFLEAWARGAPRQVQTTRENS